MNMRTINSQRLLVHSVYGADLLSQVQCIGVTSGSPSAEERYRDEDDGDDEDIGYFNKGK